MATSLLCKEPGNIFCPFYLSHIFSSSCLLEKEYGYYSKGKCDAIDATKVNCKRYDKLCEDTESVSQNLKMCVKNIEGLDEYSERTFCPNLGKKDGIANTTYFCRKRPENPLSLLQLNSQCASEQWVVWLSSGERIQHLRCGDIFKLCNYYSKEDLFKDQIRTTCRYYDKLDCTCLIQGMEKPEDYHKNAFCKSLEYKDCEQYQAVKENGIRPRKSALERTLTGALDKIKEMQEKMK